jgi:CubicO group peptidase (beta-lactamase class C family)
MPTPSSSLIEQIVNSKVKKLYGQMKAGGVAASFYYQASPQVAPYYYYGQANPSTAMSEQTIVCVGSITKTFTASLLAYLYQIGKVGSLTGELVKTWLPDVNSDTMKLFELATQTSGMPDEGGGDASKNLFADKKPSPELVNWWSNPGNFDQTEGEWVYSNTGLSP